MMHQIQTVRRFNRFYTNFLGLLNETLLDSPVTLTEGRILFEINCIENCNAKDLVNLLSLDRGYMSRILKRLERIGLIERVVDPNDRRLRNLRLTSDGSQIIRRIDHSASDHIGGVLENLNRTEREKLIKAMNDIEKILSSN